MGAAPFGVLELASEEIAHQLVHLVEALVGVVVPLRLAADELGFLTQLFGEAGLLLEARMAAVELEGPVVA